MTTNNTQERAASGAKITINKLTSGWFLIHGDGPCEYTQVPYWPCCLPEKLFDGAHPEASKNFLKKVELLAEKTIKK